VSDRSVVDKVICYVTRGEDLLVFRHRDQPEAGVQVPAGTVEPGELPDKAAVHETEEETGLSGFRLMRKLGEYAHSVEFRPENHRRHVFQLEAPEGAPDRWQHFAEDEYWFIFEWVPFGVDPGLAAAQGDLLHLLTLPAS